MQFTQTGIILNTENYSACSDFYGTTLGLPVQFQIGSGDDEITVFSLGGNYLMLEHSGVANPSVKSPALCPTKFRINVPDVDTAAMALRAKGVDIRVRRHEWGTTAEFCDPDGNRCALRSDAGFGA